MYSSLGMNAGDGCVCSIMPNLEVASGSTGDEVLHCRTLNLEDLAAGDEGLLLLSEA